jgi:hypothetical protein
MPLQVSVDTRILFSLRSVDIFLPIAEEIARAQRTIVSLKKVSHGPGPFVKFPTYGSQPYAGHDMARFHVFICTCRVR